MKTSTRIKRVATGVIFVAGMMGGQAVFAKSAAPNSEPPVTVSETRYFKDVSSYFYNTLPFLKKGFVFLDSSLSLGTEEGSVSSLVVQSSDKAKDSKMAEASPVRQVKDFVPFVNAIKTKKEALTYVMFLSRKGYPWMETVKFDYFQDVPFISLEFVHTSSATLAANGIHPPHVVMEGGKLLKKNRFIITRTVVPLDQPTLKEEHILTGKSPLEVAELAEVVEVVSEDGTYSRSTRRMPAKKFFIENPLKVLRKKK